MAYTCTLTSCHFLGLCWHLTISKLQGIVLYANQHIYDAENSDALGIHSVESLFADFTEMTANGVMVVTHEVVILITAHSTIVWLLEKVNLLLLAMRVLLVVKKMLVDQGSEGLLVL
jgi:hypothetical protein